MSTADAFRALAATLTTRLSKWAKGWLVKYVDWDDASRAEGSCWGENITDVFMMYFSGGNWLPMFVVGTENFNPTGVHVKLSHVQLILNDPATGGSRVGTALELLRDVGKFFGTRGLTPDTTLLPPGDEDVDCFFKVQVAIVPCDEGKTVDTAIFANNYQARQTPRNAMFLCNGQGVSLQLDKPNFSGQARYCLAEYNEKKGKWLEFATTTDVSKRTIEQCGTETREEAEQAIREGKTAEANLGLKGCKKSGSIMTIQVPINQEELKKPRPQAEQWHRSLAEGERREAEAKAAAAEAKEKGAAEASHASKKLKPTPPGSPVSSRVGPKVTTRLDNAKEQLPEWGSPGFGPIGTGGSAAEIGADAVRGGGVVVKQEPAATEELDDEEPVLVALSPDDFSRPAGAPLQNGGDCAPKFTSLSSLDDDDNGSGNCVYRSLSAEDDEPPPTCGGREMGMGSVADALPELESKRCRMGRFYKGPHLGEQAPLHGTNLVRDKGGGIVTIVKTIIVTCPVNEEPSEHDIKQLVQLALEDLQCGVKCGGTANSLFSEMSKKLGQVTDAITPKAVQGIVETVTAMTGSLPAGIF